MRVYDEYGYLGVQIKMLADGKRYRLGDITPLSSGIYFGHEGAAVIDGFELVGVYPYDTVRDKWGGWIGSEIKAIIEGNNPVWAAVDAIKKPVPLDMREPDPEKMSELTKPGIGPGPDRIRGEAHRNLVAAEVRELLDLIADTKAAVEREMRSSKEMEKYWMVHRPGRGGGPPRVKYDDFAAAVKEARRLAGKENVTFVILEAVSLVLPYTMLQEENIGDGPEACNCGPARIGSCSYCEEDEAVAESVSACSCYFCDPDNHDPETCEFPSCGCRPFLEALDEDLRELEIEVWPEVPALAIKLPPDADLIPKADCPCGCTDEEPECEHGCNDVGVFSHCPVHGVHGSSRRYAEYPSPLGEGEAELRREWMPRPTVDFSSSYAGWTVEDFEGALAMNLQARSDLCAGLKAKRETTHDCGGLPAGAHWCPHCGDDLRVERPEPRIMSRGEEN